MLNQPRPLILERRERYLVFESIASGGMASVHLGVAIGALGFSRLVAVKRLHGQFARNERFVHMLLEEARLAARVRHVNVVQVHDILEVDAEVFVVMEYVRGMSLADLIELEARSGERLPPRMTVPILVGALRGLHAAHESTDWDGTPLGLVHRDFSPQNIMIGTGGVPRVLDFGVAKALGRGDLTSEDEFKGKLAYAAPEQLTGGVVTRRTDLFAAGIVLWELLSGSRLFSGTTDAETFGNVLRRPIGSPRDVRIAGMVDAAAPDELDALTSVALRALERDPERRYENALEMAAALESASQSASASELGHWVELLGAERLAREHEVVRRIELVVASGALVNTEDAAVALVSPPTAADASQSEVQAPPEPNMTVFSRRFWMVLAGVCLVASAVGSGLVVMALHR